MDHLEEQTRLNQVVGPSGLFIIQETGCNKQFNDLEVGKREDEGRDAGGGAGLRMDGRRAGCQATTSVIISCNPWKKKTCKHTQTLI